MRTILKHVNAMLVHILVGIALIGAAVFLCLAPTGCASTSTASASATLQAQLSSFCAVAPNELAAIVAGKAALSQTAQNDLPIVQSFVTGACAPGVVADATTLQNFAADVLPAFTTIALEYAASQKAK